MSSGAVAPPSFSRAGTPSGDDRLTADRDELKYLVNRRSLPQLIDRLMHQLPAHHFKGEGANRLPRAHHYVTTVYFDTASLWHFRAARDGGEHDVKVRAKFYYDVHPGLTELATDPKQVIHDNHLVWFEIKRRALSRTTKTRFRLAIEDVEDFFANHRVNPSSEGLAAAGSAEADARAEALSYCRELGEALAPACAVNYRRLSFQDGGGGLRVTLDVGLAYYAVSADVFRREGALQRYSLGPPKRTETRAVLEIKRRGELPPWLSEALEANTLAPVRFSKFVAAREAVDAR